MSKREVTPEMVEAARLSNRRAKFMHVEDIEDMINAALGVMPEHPAVALLREIKWSGKWHECPYCEAEFREPHKPDCSLAKLINEG